MRNENLVREPRTRTRNLEPGTWNRRGNIALFLFAILSPAVGLAQQSWLDRPMEKWNKAGAAIPAPPTTSESRQALLQRCMPTVATGTMPDASIEKAGWMPFLHLDRRITRDDVEVVGGMSAAGPACEPTAFNLFVFVGGRFAGALSPSAMATARDGVAGAVRLSSADSLTAEFARFTAADSECCPSSVVRVSYRIVKSGPSPVLEAVEVRKVR